MNQPLWKLPVTEYSQNRLYQFWKTIEKKYQVSLPTYQDLHQWSTDYSEKFWSEVWDQLEIIGVKGSVVLQNSSDMLSTQWFPEARLNYAENLLNFAGRDESDVALIFWGEGQKKSQMTLAELKSEVSKLQQFLIQQGVVKGDRIAGFLPNLPQAIVCMLATTSLGAVWSSASPDFGVQGVLDRFGQIEPKILFVVNGYFYNEKWIDCRDKNKQISAKLPTVKSTIEVSYLAKETNKNSYLEILQLYPAQQIQYTAVEFSHPLFILFSSGTTGVPKCIVHGHGGTLLQHKKEHQLHGDIQNGDRLFYFTTLGWMMWNWLVSGLSSGATVVLYDGSPFAKSSGAHASGILFDLAERLKITHFGTSAKYLDAAAKAEVDPKKTHQLQDLRVLFSTGSPLVAEGFDYVYEKIKNNLLLASISGGTDIVSCFVLGNPLLPVYRGEIQCKGLGMAVDVFDEKGISIQQEKGELVCTKPFPSMPIGFWNDPGQKKYREAYFSRFENIWCHGDFVEWTKNQGMIIYGRSDAVLNPGGVRIGTAEIYRQVEKLPEISESIVVGQDWQGDVRVILFVKLKEGVILNQDLENKIKKTIRENTTPRHVPAKILAVKDIPRTKSGKIVELAVRNVIHNREVRNIEALANPEALNEYKNRSELQS